MLIRYFYLPLQYNCYKYATVTVWLQVSAPSTVKVISYKCASSQENRSSKGRNWGVDEYEISPIFDTKYFYRYLPDKV